MSECTHDCSSCSEKCSERKDFKEKQNEFRECNVYARKDCENCWAKLWCAGGCAANAYHATGSVKGTYTYGCDLFRKRMECAIMVKVDEALSAAKK